MMMMMMTTATTTIITTYRNPFISHLNGFNSNLSAPPLLYVDGAGSDFAHSPPQHPASADWHETQVLSIFCLPVLTIYQRRPPTAFSTPSKKKKTKKSAAFGDGKKLHPSLWSQSISGTLEPSPRVWIESQLRGFCGKSQKIGRTATQQLEQNVIKCLWMDSKVAPSNVSASIPGSFGGSQPGHKNLLEFGLERSISSSIGGICWDLTKLKCEIVSSVFGCWQRTWPPFSLQLNKSAVQIVRSCRVAWISAWR